jgi:transcriptional regulator with XRE-family HTH domain
MSTSLIGPSLSAYAWPVNAYKPKKSMHYVLMPKQAGAPEGISPVAINLRVLIEASRQRTVNAWALRNDMVQSTVNRIVNGSMDPTASMLEAIARKFGLAAWQLLVPNLDPEDPPALRTTTPAERVLFTKLKEAMEELEQMRTTGSSFDDRPIERRFEDPQRKKL